MILNRKEKEISSLLQHKGNLLHSTSLRLQSWRACPMLPYYDVNMQALASNCHAKRAQLLSI